MYPELIRPEFSDCYAFGFGRVYRDTLGGCLDAPSFTPQGSMRDSRTTKRYPMASVASRDFLADCAAPGTAHHGPQPVFDATEIDLGDDD